MVDEVREKPLQQVRGRPSRKGRSGNPAGRRLSTRNKTTVAAQELLANAAEALTRKAVDAALTGDPMAMRLCLERILPRERAVKCALPLKSAADVARAMEAVTAALAGGLITPGEAQAIARVVAPLVPMIETSDFDRRRMLDAGEHDYPPSPPTAWSHSVLTT